MDRGFMQRAVFALSISLLVGACTRDASNPFGLTPDSPFSSWSCMTGSRLVSSKLCPPLVPPSFGKEELSLAELIDIGLQNNPATKETWAQARAAAGEYGQSLSPYYPNFEFDGSYTRLRATFDVPGPIAPYYETIAKPELRVCYTLLDFGQRSSAAEGARQALYYADLMHNQQLQALLQLIMNDYYNYLYQLENLQGIQLNFENAQESLAAANHRFDLGLSALGDVAQARTQFLQSRINLTNQKQAVENSFAKLAADLGLPANVPFKVQPIPADFSGEPLLQEVAVLVEKAQSQRQDFLAAQANVYSKRALVDRAKAEVRPVVDGIFNLGRNYYSGGRHEDYHFLAAVRLSFPIFNGFYYRNGIRVAEANLEQAKARMIQTELGIVQDITTAHMSVKTSSQNLKDSLEYLESAQMEFDIALHNYQAGTGTILDVLSAQSSLADARMKRAGAHYEWFSSLAAIAYATGSLCNSDCGESCL